MTPESWDCDFRDGQTGHWDGEESIPQHSVHSSQATFPTIKLLQSQAEKPRKNHLIPQIFPLQDFTASGCQRLGKFLNGSNDLMMGKHMDMLGR